MITTATYNQATGWISITFDNIPPQETRAAMKALGFHYHPMSKRWSAKWTTEREDLAKQLAGTIGTVEIQPDYQAKAQYAEAMSTRHEQESDQRYEQARKMGSVIPFGQPILVGHYSEKADRSFRERIGRQYEKSIEEHQKAEYYADRAKLYERKAHGESPGLIYRRIRKLEAEKRVTEKQLAIAESGSDTLYYSGHLSEEQKADLKRWLSFYDSRLEVEREKYKASGGIAMERIEFQTGEYVKTTYGIGKLIKINPTTVTIEIHGHNLKIDKSEVRGKEN